MFSAKKVILVFLILLVCFSCTVSAQTVSFAEPNTVSHKDVYLYSSNGSLLGLYNTTSTGINITDQGDVFFTFKPQYSSPLDDPSSFLDGIISWFETNALALLILGAVGGLLFKRF